jgi:hypothetical protein
MGGDEHFRGLYGWGHILSRPYLKAGWDSHGVNVKYDVKFDRPVLAKSIRRDPELSDLLILRAPQATNFLLASNEAKRLTKYIRELGESAPSI